MKTKNFTAPECCAQSLIDHMSCPKLMPQMCCELKELIRRNRCMVTRRKRIHDLAKPLYRRPRYQPKCPCRSKRDIEIIREQPRRTRTEQLALPTSRQLWLFRENFKQKLSKQRLEVVNRNLLSSLLSLYSALSKSCPPEPVKRTPKWTKKEWKIHRKYLKKLAEPRKTPQPPKLPVYSMPFGEMERYKDLCLHKIYPTDEKKEWQLTAESKFFKPSARLLQIAKPVLRFDDTVVRPSPEWPISEGAKKYKASKRIQSLAVPRDKRQLVSDFKENPFSIEPNALKYKASTRIEELAEPKEFDNTHIREHPSLISPAALKAKASKRIIELAKPRERV